MTNTDTVESPAVRKEGPLGRLTGRLPTLDPTSPGLTWLGLVLAVLGFVLIAYSWGKVAALLDVSLQLPYVVSGGLTGLGLVMVGMTVVNVAARRQDAAERARQTEQLAAVLRELRETLERDA